MSGRGPTTRALTVLLAGLLLPLTGCGGDPQQQYCAAVREHQKALTGIVTGGGQDALIRALDIFRDLRSKAPSDVSDEWQQVVTRIQALDRALRDAGVDPASYDRAKPPAGAQPGRARGHRRRRPRARQQVHRGGPRRAGPGGT